MYTISIFTEQTNTKELLTLRRERVRERRLRQASILTGNILRIYPAPDTGAPLSPDYPRIA